MACFALSQKDNDRWVVVLWEDKNTQGDTTQWDTTQWDTTQWDLRM